MVTDVKLPTALTWRDYLRLLKTKLAFLVSKIRKSLLKMLNWTEIKNKKQSLFFILLIRHKQNPFKDVKRASSEKIKGWGMELFYSL